MSLRHVSRRRRRAARRTVFRYGALATALAAGTMVAAYAATNTVPNSVAGYTQSTVSFPPATALTAPIYGFNDYDGYSAILQNLVPASDPAQIETFSASFPTGEPVGRLIVYALQTDGSVDTAYAPLQFNLADHPTDPPTVDTVVLTLADLVTENGQGAEWLSVQRIRVDFRDNAASPALLGWAYLRIDI